MRDRPSNTARAIAAATVMSARDPAMSALVEPEAARLCRVMLSAGWADRRLRDGARKRGVRWAWRRWERLVLPGIVRHFMLRKRWIEARWRAAQAEGFTQLVVLAAGLDTLGVRVAASSGGDVRVVELDHPASQNAKRLSLDGEQGASGVVFAPARLDIDGSVEIAAHEGVIDVSRPTMVVIEGLMMYLPRERVEGLLREIAGLGVPRLRVAWTFVETGELESAWYAGGGRLLKWWLGLVGEPFASTMSAGEVKAVLGRCGLSLVEMESPRQLAGVGDERRGRGPVGDWVVLARR